MKRAAIYIRISTQLQHADRQHEELTAYAKSNNLEVVKIYKDVVSGFKDENEREQLNQLLQDSENNLFDVILFSEFSRLSRKVSDLTKYIEVFQSNSKELFFQKQNIWVKEKNDLGTTILIQVLGVISSYEIELFAERSISGKISAVKNRNVVLGGNLLYGYKAESGTKKMVVDNSKVDIVKKIFELYNSGKSSSYICDYLNSNGIQSPFLSNLEEVKRKRAKKGLKEKIYKNDADSVKWQKGTILDILRNKQYTGVRTVTIYKPQNLTKKSGEREVLEVIENHYEELRIIDDVLFDSVQEKIIENKNNKDVVIKHDNLLRTKLKCGCCGGNFTASTANNYTYKCFNKIKVNNIVKCSEGAEINQAKLNGLIVQASIMFISMHEHKQQTSKKIEEITENNKQLDLIIESKKNELENLKTIWLRYFDKAVMFNFSNSDIQIKKDEYDKQENEIKTSINKLSTQLAKNNSILSSLSEIEDNKLNYKLIYNNKNLMKELLNKYIKTINVYPLKSKYNLIVVKFINEVEIFLTIKSAKYRTDEIINNKFVSFFYQNDDDSFSFNPETNEFYYKKSVNGYGLNEGVIDVNTVINPIKNKLNTISFTPYVFE